MAKNKSLGWCSSGIKKSVPGIGMGKSWGRGYGASHGTRPQFQLGKGMSRQRGYGFGNRGIGSW